MYRICKLIFITLLLIGLATHFLSSSPSSRSDNPSPFPPCGCLADISFYMPGTQAQEAYMEVTASNISLFTETSQKTLNHNRFQSIAPLMQKTESTAFHAPDSVKLSRLADYYVFALERILV